MELNFSKINGTNRHLDYDLLLNNIENKLEPTCRKAELIILNKFPIPVASQATIDFIILFKVPDIHNNYYSIYVNGNRVNVKNQIIAVSVIDEYEDDHVHYSGNTLEVRNLIIDHQEDASKIKWGLTNYLADKCGLVRNEITVHPLIWLKNKHSKIEGENIFIGNNLTYHSIENVISKNYYFKWPGYRDWQRDNTLFEQHIRTIFEKASKDSEEGFITKKKIDRMHRKFGPKQEEANNNIGVKLVEVRGKAGTGKTAELLKWMLRNSLNDRKGIFLTYNHLLVNDIAYQINSFTNRLEDNVIKAPTTTNTIHGFFYNIAKKLGVLLIMSESRIIQLTNILDKRWIEIETYFNQERKTNDTSLAWLKMRVQNHWIIDQGIKREAILFIQQNEKLRFLPDQKETAKLFKDFRDKKIAELKNLESHNIFLKDYPEVLKRILQATNNLDSFLKDNDIENKYELLEVALNLKEEILLEGNSGKINFEKLRTRYKKTLSGFRAGRIVYIDEAQDCHPLERDILFNLFGSNNCVIANGEKEQLIRFSEVCKWHISQNRNIEFYSYPKPNKSYRMKPAISALANHIANWYKIDLDIEPIETEDHGQIYISTSDNDEVQLKALEELHNKGIRQGCTSYESLLLLKPPDTDNGDTGGESGLSSGTSIKINEFDNIVTNNKARKLNWDLVTKANKKMPDVYFWNATGNVDKRELAVPGSLSVRSIYYASCRGIEAWSVMCFGLDTFFLMKSSEPEADNYLLNDLFDQLNPEQRREMYAATWVLMAITRSMENCYIQLLNPQTSIYKCIMDFCEKNKEYVSLKN